MFCYDYENVYLGVWNVYCEKNFMLKLCFMLGI